MTIRFLVVCSDFPREDAEERETYLVHGLLTTPDVAMIQCKRVYEETSPEDGTRVLVDRLWPRGVSKEDAALDDWLKEVAPSDELREWFAHDPEKWDEFRRRYHQELDENADVVDRLREKAEDGTLTLVYAAKDREHNNAVALKEYLQERLTNE